MEELSPSSGLCFGSGCVPPPVVTALTGVSYPWLYLSCRSSLGSLPLSFSPGSGTGSPLFPVLRVSPFLVGFHTVAHTSCVVPSLNSLQFSLQVCHLFPAGEGLIMPLLWTVTVSRCSGAGSNLKSRWKHDLGQSEH